jgi:hypothetical protein
MPQGSVAEGSASNSRCFCWQCVHSGSHGSQCIALEYSISFRLQPIKVRALAPRETRGSNVQPAAEHSSVTSSHQSLTLHVPLGVAGSPGPVEQAILDVFSAGFELRWQRHVHRAEPISSSAALLHAKQESCACRSRPRAERLAWRRKVCWLFSQSPERRNELLEALITTKIWCEADLVCRSLSGPASTGTRCT